MKYIYYNDMQYPQYIIIVLTIFSTFDITTHQMVIITLMQIDDFMVEVLDTPPPLPQRDDFAIRDLVITRLKTCLQIVRNKIKTECYINLIQYGKFHLIFYNIWF